MKYKNMFNILHKFNSLYTLGNCNCNLLKHDILIHTYVECYSVCEIKTLYLICYDFETRNR